ncbi:GNAT family N-acetyltransferase [Rhizobium deserti]|uniref:GNAT family N-acetyltransferase n=1 Tax=Rhizobium deserti TaxID=2547961 RepID=A0A4R5UAF0_9HYPH|nr:GNAT family N-acetyltransferase [Rhizobium deserti]TDK31768.1 GNAT family N-acetyltransferase [Rhizobium deserti]
MTRQAEAISDRERKVEFTAIRHDHITTVEEKWQQLQTQGPATAFQHFGWMKAIEAYLCPPANARGFVVEITEIAAGRTLMFIPFAIIKKPGYSAVEYLSLGVCDVSMPILIPGYDFPEHAGGVLWEAIMRVLPKADLVYIDQIPRLMRGTTNPLACAPGVRQIEMRSFAVAIEGAPASVVERIANGQMRRILKTSRRRLEEHGEVKFIIGATKAELDRLLAVMVAQRLERFRQLGRFDPLSRSDVREFYKAAASAGLAGESPARVFGLSVGGEIVATAYGLVTADTFHLVIVSMADGKWLSCSPGTAVLAHVIKWARQQGLTTMDFSIGDLAYKEQFGGKPQPLYALSVPLTGKGTFILQLQRLKNKVASRLRSRTRLWTVINSIRSRAKGS